MVSAEAFVRSWMRDEVHPNATDHPFEESFVFTSVFVSTRSPSVSPPSYGRRASPWVTQRITVALHDKTNSNNQMKATHEKWLVQRALGVDVDPPTAPSTLRIIMGKVVLEDEASTANTNFSLLKAVPPTPVLLSAVPLLG